MRLVIAKLYHSDADIAPAERAQLEAAAFGQLPTFSEPNPPDHEHPGCVAINHWFTDYVWELGKVPARLLGALRDARDIVDPRLEDLAARTQTVVNQRVHVAVPGLGLLAVSEVCVRYDHCTDALANDLAEGWRIVAVCPQPDQRRPDYVLGRPATEETVR